MPNARVPDLPEDRTRTEVSVRPADEEGTAIGREPESGVSDRVDVFFRDLGPGLITGCADDDPSGISTYSIAGAAFGYGTLWTALISFPLMVSVQMMCSRLGMVTGRGLASVIRMHYPRWVLWGACLLLITANVVNIAADLGGMGESAAMVTGRERKALDAPLYGSQSSVFCFGPPIGRSRAYSNGSRSSCWPMSQPPSWRTLIGKRR